MPPPSRKHADAQAGLVQIARELGVSPSTVSRALRPQTAHLVKEERRREILALAERLQFSPNLGARLLRQGGLSALTVVVPHDEKIFFSEYYGRLLACLLAASSARGWEVIIKTLRRRPEQSLRTALQQLDWPTAGVIYLGEPLRSEEALELAGWRRPLVVLKAALPDGIDVSKISIPIVGVDNQAGAQAAADLVVQLGHRRIALLLGPEGSRDAQERRRGYLEVLHRRGVPMPEGWLRHGDFSAQAGREAFRRLWARKEHPTAFCCANDEIAFGVIDEARAQGVRCPEDVTVVGFDDGPWAMACRPALTTVRQPFADLAERAVSLIVEKGHERSRAPFVGRDFSPSLVIRESSGRLRG